MTALVRSELLKLRTTRATLGNLIAAVAAVVLSVTATIVSAGKDGMPALDTADGIRSVMGSAGNGCVLALVLGIIAVAGEYRHNTITAAFLASPHRGRVIAAKAAAMTLLAAVIAVVCCATTLAVSLPWLSSKDVPVDLLSSDVAGVLAGSMFVTLIYALIGVGIGAMIRNQVAAVVGALGWQLIVENAVVGLLPAAGKWLPLGAANALTMSGTLDHPLPIAAALGLLTAYAAVALAGGMRLTTTKDIA